LRINKKLYKRFRILKFLISTMKFKLEEILKGIGTTILAGALAFAIAGSAYAYKSASSKEKTRIKKEALLLAEKQEKEKTENFNKDLDNFNKRFFRIVENGEIGNSLERFCNAAGILKI